MKTYIEEHPDKDDPPQFEAPGNIIFVSVDKANGAVLTGESSAGIHEAFIAGTQPGGLARPQ